MRRLAVILAALAWTGAARADAPAPSSSAVPELPDLAARISPSVVLVKLYDAAGKDFATGSGFFVGSDGRVITNHHVIDGAASAKVILSDSREAKVLGVLADDPENDLALLKVEGDHHPSLTLIPASRARVGEDVVVIGSPLGLSTTVTTGILSAVREKGIPSSDDESVKASAWTLHFTAPTSSGSSGSPVLTRQGEVIGVAVGGAHGTSGMNFGVRAERAIELLARAGTTAKDLASPPPPEQQRHELARNLAISTAVFFGLFIGWRVLNRDGREEKPKPAKRAR